MEDIHNCSWKWQFQCPRRWNSLRDTADPKVRSCDSCLENVYLCETEEEVLQRAAQGQCAAFQVPAPHVAGNIDRRMSGMTMGFISPTRRQRDEATLLRPGPAREENLLRPRGGAPPPDPSLLLRPGDSLGAEEDGDGASGSTLQAARH
jgi:hypothetical protein